MKYLVGLLVLGIVAFPSITKAQTVDPIQSQIDALVAQVTELQKLLTLIQQVEALTARLEAVEGKQTINDRNEDEPVLGGAPVVVPPTLEVHMSAYNDDPQGDKVSRERRCFANIEFRSDYDSYRISVNPVSGHIFDGDNHGYRATGGASKGAEPQDLPSGAKGALVDIYQDMSADFTPVVYSYSFTAIRDGAETTKEGTFTIKKEDGVCEVDHD